ncbi:histidine kinase [Paenibacillus sp. IB182496]|uniref:histidine kinase n=1 Tax=Paenibacillus sabuli TaxID=2772509 RepID=A0A927GQQ0_9BACL|nr:ATP-binding protein [Paenibacillus sabuli]MBD2844754.1 histidine kinase [Paenibacillus sabuli]
MAFSKVFFTNISLLITFGYIFNLGYKYAFLHAPMQVKMRFSVPLFIFAGWFTMLFGLQLTDTILFDLRFVPLIFAALVYRNPLPLLVVGIGIGVGRFIVGGFNAASTAGFLNMAILGVAAAVMAYGFARRETLSFRSRAAISIVVINTLNVANIAWFGILPTRAYLLEIAVITYPLGLALSAFFIFIIRDFYKEQKRVVDLRNMNIILRRQTRELREAKRELEGKAHELALASQYKSEFLANMSHELKTPLNSIILLSQMIREIREEKNEAGEEAEGRYADIINSAGHQLLHLINDILDLSKVEAGKMEIVVEPVSVSGMLQSIVDQFEPVADSKKLAFRLDMASDVPEMLYTDEMRATQIIKNLLANAFKFTESGTISLIIRRHVHGPDGVAEEKDSARPRKPQQLVRGRQRRWGVKRRVSQGSGASHDARRSVDNRGWIAFAVHDTGIGIDETKQYQIFEAFRQADGATNRKYGGTGLGLSISLQLAGLLGGTLTLKSSQGKGSLFTLWLPVRESPELQQ